MINKFIMIILSILIGDIASAAGAAQLRIRINDVKQSHPHFLCIYNAGCFNLLSIQQQSTYFALTGVDLANVKKIGLLNLKTKQLYLQTLPTSCDVMGRENEVITLSGNMTMQAAKPYIANLHCQISAV